MKTNKNVNNDYYIHQGKKRKLYYPAELVKFTEKKNIFNWWQEVITYFRKHITGKETEYKNLIKELTDALFNVLAYQDGKVVRDYLKNLEKLNF